MEKTKAYGFVATGREELEMERHLAFGGLDLAAAAHITKPGNSKLSTHHYASESSSSSSSSSVTPTPDLVTASSLSLKFAQRKKRTMVRQKRSASSSSSSLSALALRFQSPGSGVHVRAPSPQLLPARAPVKMKLNFLFKKQLKNSDVSSLRRMVLPKRAAEEYLPVLEVKEGILIVMHDLDGLHVWQFKFRFWPNNNSRMYVLENTGTIAAASFTFHLLQVIEARKGLSADVNTDKEPQDISREDGSNAVQGLDYELDTSSLFPESFPKVDDMGLSFIYDTSFSNDSPLDFLGGSMTNYSRVGSQTNFASLDSLCFNDFFNTL